MNSVYCIINIKIRKTAFIPVVNSPRHYDGGAYTTSNNPIFKFSCIHYNLCIDCIPIACNNVIIISGTMLFFIFLPHSTTTSYRTRLEKKNYNFIIYIVIVEHPHFTVYRVFSPVRFCTIGVRCAVGRDSIWTVRIINFFFFQPHYKHNNMRIAVIYNEQRNLIMIISPARAHYCSIAV